MPKLQILLLRWTSQGFCLEDTRLKLLLRVSQLIHQDWLHEAEIGTNSYVYLHLMYRTTSGREWVCACCMCICNQEDGIRRFSSMLQRENPVSLYKPLISEISSKALHSNHINIYICGGLQWSSLMKYPNPFYPYVVTSPKDNLRLLSVASFPFFLPERAFCPDQMEPKLNVEHRFFFCPVLHKW